MSASLYALLDVRERGVYESLADGPVRAQYLTAHALLRSVLGAALERDPAGLVFAAGPYGKPYLTDAPVEFSISHSGELVAVALSADAPVGVDVERITAPARLPLPVLSAQERTVFDRVPQSERAAAFTSYWVRKEAVLKATGEGLRVDPARLTVSAPDRPAELLAWRGRDGGQPHPPVRLYDLDAGDGYRGAVALLGADRRIVRHDGGGVLRRPRRSVG
ncbi:4'-phosphopantetheinyl transferase family protein [Streptomyces sp. NPDC057411]|uniref:4'-phosphopantetheinyl transferase family protein n=1 Tax=unclassified Streptomyces TaxID=2593676 RepID=UPI0036330068